MTAWYDSSCDDFIKSKTDSVVGQLAMSAAGEGWRTTPEQQQEWTKSVDILKSTLSEKQEDRSDILQSALADPRLHQFQSIILEYE